MKSVAADASPDEDLAKSIRARWGDAVSGGEKGFQPVPDLLLRHQHRLGLTNTELTVLLNITMHWWRAGRWPFPRPSAIARRMGTSARTVERTIQSLEEKKFIVRLAAERNDQDLLVRQFDLSGLIGAVNQLAHERGRE